MMTAGCRLSLLNGNMKMSHCLMAFLFYSGILSLTNKPMRWRIFYRERWRLAGVLLKKLAGGTPALPGCLSKS
jgi:hypothetical protein